MSTNNISRRKAILLCALLPSTTLAACGRPKTTLRYRLTVELAGGGKIYTGSTVTELRHGHANNPLSVMDTSQEHSLGNALPISVGRKTLFIPIIKYASILDDLMTFGSIEPDIDLGKPGKYETPRRLRLLKRHRARIALLTENERYKRFRSPWQSHRDRFMCYFENRADPYSLKWLLPSDLPKFIGNSGRIWRYTVEVTNEPISSGIEKLLPWLPASPSEVEALNKVAGGGMSINTLFKDP